MARSTQRTRKAVGGSEDWVGVGVGDGGGRGEGIEEGRRLIKLKDKNDVTVENKNERTRVYPAD